MLRIKLAILCCVLAAIAAAQDTATVEGVVVNKVTGAGIDGATVWLWIPGNTSYKAVTNEAGIFQVTGLKPGDYAASVEKSGYSNPSQEVLVLPGDQRPPHPIKVGPEPAHLRFELNPPAVLRGRVTGPDGTPARASVVLGPGLTTNTNADGVFSFEKLWPGSYTLLARPLVPKNVKDAKRVSAKDEIRTEPVPTYYPSVQDRSLAETITIHAGAELNGYDVRLQSAEVHRVRGIVLDLDGKPASKATVELQARVPAGTGITFTMAGSGGLMLSIRNGPGSGQSDEPSVVTAADGVFEFPSVRAGEWIVRVHSDWIRDEIQQRNILRFGSAAFRIEHDDLEDVKIPFATPFNLSLPTVVTLGDGSAPAPGVSIALTLMSETGSGMTRSDIKTGGPLQLDNVLPGAQRIQADVAAGNYYVDSIWLGTMNITGQSVELTPASPPIKIVLKPAGTVRGTIDADAGTIVLFPQSFEGAGYLAQSGAGKTFEISGIAPGDYYAIALDRFDPEVMRNALRLRGLMPGATSVRVDQSSAASVQLKVNHPPD